MKIFKNKLILQKEISKDNCLSFVPTMGGLHKGHLSLIKKAKKYKCKICVSIFVDPNQFNKQIDSNNYKTKLEFREYLELLNQILFSGEIFLDDKWNRENSFNYLNNKFNIIISKSNK